MEQFGEAIHGHHGEYVTQQYGNAPESMVREKFLKYTEVGEQDSCNQILFLDDSESTSYIWSTFSSKEVMTDTAGIYQHAVYQDCTISNIYNVEQLVDFPFMSAAECDRYLGDPEEFCVGTRRENIQKKENENKEFLSNVDISKDLLVYLAVYCVSKTITASKKFLYILVPNTAEDYQGYCRSVITQLLNMIPAGLRKNISIATNSTNKNEEHFGILFRRDKGKDIKNSVRLNDKFKKNFLEDTYISPDIRKIINACANDELLIADCYKSIELKYEESGRVDEKYYSEYYTWYQLKTAPFDCALMKKLNDMLEEEQGEQNAVSVIKGHIHSIKTVEDALEQNAEWERARDIDSALSILNLYESLLRYLNGEGIFFSDFFAKKILDRITLSSDEKALEVSCQELKKNQDRLAQYFSKQYIENYVKELEENRINIICERLAKEILMQPTKESVDRVFKEVREIGDTFKIRFGEYLCERLSIAIDSEKIDQDKACSLYFPINNYVKINSRRYFEQSEACLKKKFMQEIEKEPSAGVIKNGFATLKHLREWTYEEIKEIFERLYIIYTSEKNQEKLLEYHISEVIDILKENLWDSMMQEKMLEWYYDYRIWELKLCIEKKPQLNDIEELFFLVKEIGLDREKEVVQNVYERVIRYFTEIQFKQNQIKAMCKDVHSFRKILNEQAGTLELDDEKKEFDKVCSKYLTELLLKSLTETIDVKPLDINEVREIFEYAKESLTGFDRFYEKACAMLEQINREKLSGVEIEQINDVIYKYGRFHREYCDNRYTLRTYNREEQRKKELFESYMNKLGAEKVNFSSFLRGIFLAEEKQPLDFLMDNCEYAIDLYKEEFSYLYKNKMSILLEKNCEISNLDLQIFLYKEFLKRCEENIIYFMEKKGKITKAYSIDIVEEVWKTLYKIQNESELRDIEKERDNCSCLKLLLPYCKLTKKNRKILTEAYGLGEWNKLRNKRI